MSQVKWIKIVTDIFDDEKILLIESLPSADSIIVIWFKLLCLAGKNNNNGVFLMNDRIAYTDEMLATIFRRDINTVRLALKTFEDFGMIDVIEGVITIPNWGKHQTLDKLEKKTEYMRNYMREYREKQKQQIECKTNSKTNDEDNCNDNSNSNVSEAELEEYKEDLYKKEKENISNTKVFDCPSFQDEPQKYVMQEYVDKWNTLESYGVSKCQRLTADSQRVPMLKKRLREFGEDSFDKVIEQIKESDFLLGRISSPKRTPFNINFGWVIKPENYRKILEGQYKNRTKINGDFTGSAFDHIDIGE